MYSIHHSRMFWRKCREYYSILSYHKSIQYYLQLERISSRIYSQYQCDVAKWNNCYTYQKLGFTSSTNLKTQQQQKTKPKNFWKSVRKWSYIKSFIILYYFEQVKNTQSPSICNAIKTYFEIRYLLIISYRFSKWIHLFSNSSWFNGVLIPKPRTYIRER